MAGISKKTSTAKNRSGGTTKSASGDQRPQKSAKHNGAATTGTAKRADGRMTNRDAKGQASERDEAARALSRANEHLERAWEKIYEGHSKSRKAA